MRTAKKEADMHLHSFYSDGDASVPELIKRMKEAGVKAGALTDHDKTDGVAEFICLCAQEGIEAITGIEISTSHRPPCAKTDIELHILGYDFNLVEMARSQYRLVYNHYVRREHILGIMALYKKTGALDLSFEKLAEMFQIPPPVINRYWAEKARALDLIKKTNGQLTFANAYQIAKQETKIGGKFYYPRGKFLETEKAIELIKSCGGKAVWAHPMLYLKELREISGGNAIALFKETFAMLKLAGLNGAEVYTARNSASETEFLLRVCDALGLDPNFGGSDYHGDKDDEHMPGEYIGKGGINYQQFLQIKK